MYDSCWYQSISKDKGSYLPGTFPGLKPYLHFYYNYSTIYSCFNYNFTGGANADNYTVSGMGFEKLLLQALVIIIVEVDIVINFFSGIQPWRYVVMVLLPSSHRPL